MERVTIWIIIYADYKKKGEREGEKKKETNEWHSSSSMPNDL